AVCYYNPQSKQQNAEYSGPLYRLPNGSWTYTGAERGQEGDSPVVVPPGNAIPEAWYHTHGDYVPKYGSGNFEFSPRDKWFSDITGKPNYMADPNDEVHLYDPKKQGKHKNKDFGKCP
ncbi:MAG: DUF4329 domain-containing protein, partial [Gammaproteobacteria bacterium]